MRPHHERVIQRLTELFKDDPRFPALIVGGSIAKRREQENSDVDIMLVAADEEYAKRAANMDFWYLNREICDYPGGYVEGRYIDCISNSFYGVIMSRSICARSPRLRTIPYSKGVFFSS